MRRLVPKIPGTKITLSLTRLHSLFPVCDMVRESGDRYGRYVRVAADEMSGTSVRLCVCACVCLAVDIHSKIHVSSFQPIFWFDSYQ